MARMIWPAPSLALLRELYGTMPTREIAERLGRSRNAVIGQAYRLGLAKPSPMHRKANRNRPKEVPMSTPVEPKEPTRGLCHFIAKEVTDPAWSYCHKPVREPRMTCDGLRSVDYCAEHYSLMYVPPKPPAQKATVELFRQQRRAA